MSKELPAGIERILFTEEQIEARIGEVASEISQRYCGRTVHESAHRRCADGAAT